MMLVILIVVLVLVAVGAYAFLSNRKSAADSQRDALVAQGFAPCPERHADVERRYNDLSTTTGQGGYAVRDPFCADVAGHSVFFFLGVPPAAMARGSGMARPRPAFMLPFSGVAGRAQVWLTNSAIEASPMLSQKIKLAMSVLDGEVRESTLATLEVPQAWAAHSVIGAIGEPGRTLDALLGPRSGDALADAAEHGFFQALFGDGWLVLEHFPFPGAISAPHGSLSEQIAFVKGLATGARR